MKRYGKTLHRNILNVSRNWLRAKLLVIATLEKLSRIPEEYLVLLPEAIPFLGELLEDDDLEVEIATQDLLDKLTKFEWRRLELVGAWLRRVERSKYRGRAAESYV